MGYPLGAARAPARGDVPGGHRADPGMEWGGGRQREGDGVGTGHRVRRQKGNRERGQGAQAAPRDARRTARISRRKPPVLRVLGTPQTCPWVLGGEKANPRITAASHPKIQAAFRKKSSRCEQKSLALQDSVPPGRVQPVPPPDTVRGRSQGICLPSEHPRCYRAARLFRDLSCLSSGGVISSGRSSRAPAALGKKHSRSCAPRH